ncbi:MAG TPA: MBL fold metallo-hydrolase [bacterium (Candidatus Stahlbacteria)]|nr:MBL fold metallo-hydrolase [Candidatus Stahlbacteria bacterium]
MDRIIFLGTAGARVTVFKQIRASGGIWLTLDDTNILIDPGPGSLIRCLRSKAKLNPENLDAIILSHKHLDHSADVNVMIEAMTGGGFKKKGILFAPIDALEQDPVVLRYLRNYPDKIEILREGAKYTVKNVKFTTPIRHIHGVETYGINFVDKRASLSYITDTRYFEAISNHYKGDILIINVVRLKPSQYDHLCLEDAKNIIKTVNPKLAILTHFGMTMIKAKPWELADKLSSELGTKVIAASDGMSLNLSSIAESTSREKS